MAPPLFADLGKAARDVFFRGYNFGFVKSDTTTKSGDIELKTNIAQNISAGTLAGAVDVKYKIPQHGATLSERWNTENILTTEVIVDDKILKGLKLILDTSYAPAVGKRSGKVKGEYRHEKATLHGEMKLNGAGGPILTGSAVYGYAGWLFGAQAGYDPSKAAVTGTHYIVAVNEGDFGFHAFMQNNTEFGGSIYHKVNRDLELAANMSWATGEQTCRFGVAAKCELDQDMSLRVKLNNASQLALALTHSLKPGLKITASAAFNIQNINDGSHKLGVGLEFTP